MAKRKLSESQRASIRTELASLLRTAKTKAEAFRSVAKKYGITTITARWYSKTLKGAPKPAKAKAAKAAPAARKAAAAPAKPRGRAAARNGHGVIAGAVGKIVAGALATAGKAFARAREAKKLIPQWQQAVQKEFSLRKVERKVRQELRLVAKKARTLHQKIKSLTS
jgi:hypothetical protein